MGSIDRAIALRLPWGGREGKKKTNFFTESTFAVLCRVRFFSCLYYKGGIFIKRTHSVIIMHDDDTAAFVIHTEHAALSSARRRGRNRLRMFFFFFFERENSCLPGSFPPYVPRFLSPRSVVIVIITISIRDAEITFTHESSDSSNNDCYKSSTRSLERIFL